MEDPNQPPPASSTEAPDAASAPTAASPPPPLEPPQDLIAPGVPRMPPPRGAARSARDPNKRQPSFVFLAVVSILTLVSDIGTKAWAEHRLDVYPPVSPLWQTHLTFTLARNRGGAWGLLQGASENVRRPFFLLVSVAAITFIVTLYRRLQPRQRALKWGLPLVLGGALGNVFDRIRYGHVIDFIDCHMIYKGIEKHWPTFNIADVAICVGVGLMAIDMFSSKRGARPVLHASPIAPAQSGEPSVYDNGALVLAD